MSIESVTMRGAGAAPWVNAVVEWTGTSATWTLTNTGTSQVLYTGPDLKYDMAVLPETIYHLSLSDDTNHTQPFAYVSPPISAPVDLTAIDITDTSALLTWLEVEAADQYEVIVDDVSYNVLPPPPPVDPEEEPEQPSLALGGLIPDRTYEAQSRAYIDTTASLLSPLYHFTTDPTTVAEASVYEYEPVAARVWGKSGWLPDGSALYHGDGVFWSNTNGIHTTVFMYSNDTLTSLHELQGVRVVSVQVSISRFSALSDPRMVLSHWLLHDMDAIGTVAPVFIAPAMGIDSGSVALDEQAWMSLPTGWGDALINDEATGIGWGGITGRYMIGPHISDPIRPMNGTLRITVA